MEIKLELDTEKTTKAAVAIAAAYGLCQVSESNDFPQLAAANALALIVVRPQKNQLKSTISSFS